MTHRSFFASPFFAFRTPLLPFEAFEALTEGAAAPAAVGDLPRLELAVAADRAIQRRRLQALLARPEVREALFVASPDLDDALESWFRAPGTEKGERAERAALRYVSRMTARSTPFGLFAASAVGRLGPKTRLVVEPQSSCRRRSRLDMDYLFALTEELGRDPALRAVLTYRVNSTLYRIGDRLRYVETRLDGQERTCHLVAVEESPYLDRALEGARAGATLEELAALVADEEVGKDEARAFVSELVDEQLLVPDLPLRLTSLDPVTDLVAVLEKLGPARQTAAALAEAAADLQAIDAGGVGVPPATYRRIAERLAGLPVKPELSRLVQVDLVKLAPRAQLGDRVIAELDRGIGLLHRMMTLRTADLHPFVEAFEERYGQREVSLAEALDDESGIGFPAWAEEDSGCDPLLQGVVFPPPRKKTTRWADREEHLLRLLGTALSDRASEVELSDRDVEALAAKDPLPLPGAFAALARVSAPSDEALDRGEFRVVLDSAGGPSGARFLGRFCHADPALRRFVEEHLKAEEALDPDAVFAEIVHLPEGRTGNVLTRPRFRGYEIPYLGDAGTDEERQIPITDLTIRVQRGEIVLRSARLGRRVVPRLTAAHNYVAYGLGLYRLLCSLQAQGTAGALLWDWGALSTAPFLPRIVKGRVVLSVARWTVSRDELAPLAKLQDGPRFSAVSAWRARRCIPRYAYMVEAANELLVDFDSVLSVDSFLRVSKERSRVELKEMLPSPEGLCAAGPEGRYVHEILITYVSGTGRHMADAEEARERPAALAIAPAPAPASGGAGPSVRRLFPPGSEWLTAKLYGGSPTLDRLLRTRLGEEVQALGSGGAIDRWFFVRFSDPRTHLRIRLHGDPHALRDEAWPRLGKAASELLESGLVWKLQLDTYDREMERYGGPRGIDLAERLFHVDSETVLEILQQLEPGDAGEEERWRLALAGTDRLLDDLGLSLEEKRGLLKDLRSAWGREHNEDAALKRSLGDSYRDREPELAGLIGCGPGAPDSLAPGVELFRRRSERIKDLVERMDDLLERGLVTASRGSFAASFVHMFLNRLFASSHGRQELVVYEFLSRSYRSTIARSPGHDRGPVT